jgi:sarcosine oxidase subunit alpha
MPNVIVKNRSQVFGYYDHNMLVMSERISDHFQKQKNFIQNKDFGILELKKF